MKITLKTFAQVREIMGMDQLSLELPVGATLQTCLEKLTESYPHLASKLPTCRLALNLNYVRDMQTPLQEGDVVALIPPVSGG